MFTVYVLRSQKNGRLYIGSTENFEKRLFEHNSGYSKYTRATRPFILIYKEEYSTRTQAVARERQLKSGQGREWLNGKVGITVA